jgi:hypothetical protein
MESGIFAGTEKRIKLFSSLSVSCEQETILTTCIDSYDKT